MAQREWAEKDYYKVLGVDDKADKAEIKRAYRKLAQRYHPDANKGDPAAEARFKEVSEAHAVLGNDQKRKEYDEMRSLLAAGGQRFYGYRPGQGGGGVRVNVGDIGDLFGTASPDGGSIFDDLLSGFGGGRTARRRGGQDTETEVMLSFDDAVAGTMVTLPQGGRARIPAGISDGARIRVPGRGEPDPFGGPPGDLYVRVHVRPHHIWRLRGNGDVEADLPVTIAEAALGSKVTVPTLEDEVTVKLAPGTQHGKTLRVRGKGAPRPRGGRGDAFFKVSIEVPTRLSKAEREALERFHELHGAHPRTSLQREIRRTARAG